MSKKDGYSKVHDGLSPADSARQVAQFKNLFGRPYKLVAVCRGADAERAVNLAESGGPGGEELLALLKSPPSYFNAVSYTTLSALLDDWRKFEPEGEWLLFLSGRATQAGVVMARTKGSEARVPLGFIDTPVLEKAIKYHREQGHGGEI